MRRIGFVVLASAALVLTACGPQAPAPSPAAETQSAAQIFGLATRATFHCADGAKLSVRFDEDRHEASVLVDGEGVPTLLKGVMSGSGSRYEGAGVSFHNKGQEATWTAFGKMPTRCVEVLP